MFVKYIYIYITASEGYFRFRWIQIVISQQKIWFQKNLNFFLRKVNITFSYLQLINMKKIHFENLSIYKNLAHYKDKTVILKNVKKQWQIIHKTAQNWQKIKNLLTAENGFEKKNKLGWRDTTVISTTRQVNVFIMEAATLRP